MNAFVVDILRTPIGKYGGALSSVRPDDLAAAVHPDGRLAEDVRSESEDRLPGARRQVLGGAGQGHLARNLARGGVEDVAEAAARAGDLLAVDEMMQRDGHFELTLAL